MTDNTIPNPLYKQDSGLAHVWNLSHTWLPTESSSPQYFVHPLKQPDTDNLGCSSSLYSSSVFPEVGSKQSKHVGN